MPTPKTECTELAVGFGILGIEPTTVNPIDIGPIFQNTLTEETYQRFIHEYRSRPKFYRRFYSVGVMVRQHHRVLSRSNIDSVRWEGQYQQARTTSLARDLTVANIPISVKAKSNVVFNRSPHTFFVSRPSGTASETKSKNWFLAVAPESYQALYAFVQSRYQDELPEHVSEYHVRTTEAQRKSLGKLSTSLPPNEQRLFDELYWSFCREVAEKSSNSFNEALKRSLSGKQKNSVIEYMMRDLFRMSDSEYILCGLDGLDRNNEFAVAVPSLTTWRQSWSVRSLTATPDLTAKQSKVKINLITRNDADRRDYALNFHVEIRWSHGQLNGSPEAKVYKDFRWVDVPFFEKLIEPSLVQKLDIIGSGGFGVVRRAIIPKHKEPVALKELSADTADGISAEEARYRFEREVTIQASLKHPNILSILDHSFTDSPPWFASPLAQFSTEDILSELAHDQVRTHRLFIQVIQAVEYAHSRSVIHRDIKPANILVFDGDIVKLCDFGLGKKIGDSGVSLTKSSSITMGSEVYMAPEQMERFRDVDHRADIFSMGMTLFAFLSGKEPKIRHISLQSIPSKYHDFIMRCINEDPEERFQTVSELRHAFLNIP